MDYPKKLRQLATLKAREKKAKEAAENAEHKRRDLESQIHQQMEVDGIQTIKTGDHTFTRKSTVYGTIQDMDAFINWCKDNNLVNEFIQEAEHRGRLNELVRDYQDNKQELPPGVGFRVRDYISTTEN